MSDQDFQSADLQLYPTEETAIKEQYVFLNRKWAGKIDTQENLIAFATETSNRFKELGLQVEVDITNVDLVGDQPVISPIINIVGRIEQEVNGHDHARHSAEVQAGLADGVVGKVTADGRLVDPSQKY